MIRDMTKIPQVRSGANEMRGGTPRGSWSQRYGDRHRAVRVDVPKHLAVLRHARTQQRNGHCCTRVWHLASSRMEKPLVLKVVR